MWEFWPWTFTSLLVVFNRHSVRRWKMSSQ
uniref:Uncharacterized protein n=1 Tax=Vitis vinifera TaxID=29760 RepID=F6HTN5_VITVI